MPSVQGHRNEERNQLTTFVSSDLSSIVGGAFVRSFDELAKSTVPSFDFKLDNLLPENELKSIQDSLSGVWKTLSESLVSVFDFDFGINDDLLKHITEQARDILKPIQVRFPEIDWAKANAGAEKWGEYGWAIPINFSFFDVSNPPCSLSEANALYKMKCGIGTEEFLRTRARIVANARKRLDTEEALKLFDEKRYKPCAMMLCSLIEGEIRHSGGKSTRAKSPASFAEKQLNDLRDMAASLSFAVNYKATINYFFRSTRTTKADFDMALEGEMNRNILMHGMMYAPVRQQTCIKLIYLYDSTIRMISQ